MDVHDLTDRLFKLSLLIHSAGLKNAEDLNSKMEEASKMIKKIEDLFPTNAKKEGDLLKDSRVSRKDLIQELSNGLTEKYKIMENGTLLQEKTGKIYASQTIYENVPCELLKELDHPCLLRVFDTYKQKDDKKTVLVVESLDTEEDRTLDKITFEKNALTKTYFVNIVGALLHMYTKKISYGQINSISIVAYDNGLVKLKSYTRCSTRTKETQEEDVFMLGVLLCYMLTGGEKTQKWNKLQKELKTAVSASTTTLKLLLEKKNINKEDEDAIPLIVLLLTKALPIKKIVKHPWLAEFKQMPAKKTLIDHIVAEAVEYTPILDDADRQRSELLSLITYIQTFRMSEKEVVDLSLAFSALDTKEKGYLTWKQLAKGLKKWGSERKMPAKTLTEMLNKIDAIDINNDGRIGYLEFVSAFIDKKTILEKDSLKQAFFELSKGAEFITPEHFKDFFKENNKASNKGQPLLSESMLARLANEVQKKFGKMMSYSDFKKFYAGLETKSKEG